LHSFPIGTLFLATSHNAMAEVDVNSIWNDGDLTASEARFRELAKSANADVAAVLETQIARTYGLRRRFDEARGLLARLEPRLSTLGPEARARYHLEYGRSLISAVHEHVFQELAHIYTALGDPVKAEHYTKLHAQQKRTDAK
jgi:hypothetical protein